MNKIDLHGLTESEAIPRISMAFMDLEIGHSSTEIIVGKGQVLGNLVFDMAEREGYGAKYNGTNRGSIIVYA